MMRRPIARRFVASLKGADIACWRDERLQSVTGATVRRDLGLLSHVFEVARRELRWEYIDLKQRIAFLPATKNGDGRTVPLSSTGAEAATQIRRLASMAALRLY